MLRCGCALSRRPLQANRPTSLLPQWHTPASRPPGVIMTAARVHRTVRRRVQRRTSLSFVRANDAPGHTRAYRPVACAQRMPSSPYQGDNSHTMQLLMSGPRPGPSRQLGSCRCASAAYRRLEPEAARCGLRGRAAASGVVPQWHGLRCRNAAGQLGRRRPLRVLCARRRCVEAWGGGRAVEEWGDRDSEQGWDSVL